ESDIQNSDLDYPLTDEKMAELLEKLSEEEPAVCVLDIWRDRPVPKSGVSLTNFNRVLLEHTNIVGIYTLGGISPPPALMPFPDRLGVNGKFPLHKKVEENTPQA